ncbi:cytoskeleton-associated protein 2-like [Vombatus ursinus]|uniref:Cytoskeleton-associated protein 2 C-terminal domain-containing protein n=1 Tax=Vombatus ursinus TaxID=29139 RepID=A0A4X2KHC8_VOMUR|nr:cytoskeleton-associated protein 2-like [Vombatus ursinus]
MVGSAAQAAAVEERRKKLQEYLAAKGKLKCPNIKPYLKDQKQCSNPPTSRSTARPKNDAGRWAQSHAGGRPTANVLQPGSSNVNGSQRPKPAAAKIPRKGPITGPPSSEPDSKLPGNTHIHPPQKVASSTALKLTRKPLPSSESQCMRRSSEQETTANHRIAGWMDSVPELHTENQLLDDFAKETNKENWPLPATVELKRKPESGFCNTAKSKGNPHNPSKRGLAPKQAGDKGAKNSDLRKDQVNKPLVHKIQAWVPAGNSQQQLPKGAGCERPGDKHPRTVPSHLVQSLARTQESKKLVTRKEVGKVNKDEKEGRNGSKLQGNAVIKQTIERRLPRTNSAVPQVGRFNRCESGQQDLRLMQPCPKRKSSVRVLPSRTTTRQPHLMCGTSKGHTHGLTKNQSNYSLKKEPQTLDSKTKRTVPWNYSVRSLNPTAQPSVGLTKPTTSERGMRQPALLEAPSPQVQPNTQKKRGKEDRRKKLEEWLASKGKTYKRPPMKFLAQNKNMQKFNLSFWKSIREEEEETKTAELDLSNKIKSSLAECLKLVEEGVHSEEILAILSGFPEAEKFATFWICKAKLLASTDSSEVIGLYEAAVRCGAEPIQELRDVVLSILKSAKRITEGITSEINSTSVKEVAKEETSQEFDFLPPRERVQTVAAPQTAKKCKDNHLMPCIKLQITPLPRTPGMPEKQDVKLITPVRRSLRIEHARPAYPDALQEHSTVVASLDELSGVTEADCFIYCNNEALPEETELQIFGAL